MKQRSVISLTLALLFSCSSNPQAPAFDPASLFEKAPAETSYTYRTSIFSNKVGLLDYEKAKELFSAFVFPLAFRQNERSSVEEFSASNEFKAFYISPSDESWVFTGLPQAFYISVGKRSGEEGFEYVHYRAGVKEEDYEAMKSSLERILSQDA